MKSHDSSLDHPDRLESIQSAIEGKQILSLWYRRIYRDAQKELASTPSNGIVLELGSGASFIKQIIPETVTSDVIQYPNVDRVVDATRMPFGDHSLRFIFLMNVLHHIPDPEAFFREANRCLIPSGKMVIVDQYASLFSYWIYKFLHHEPFRPDAQEWSFPSSGPLSGANGALAQIIFKRDLKRFQTLFPSLKIIRNTPHSPLTYWVSGGLKPWCLIPGFLAEAFLKLDQALGRVFPILCSFITIVIQKSEDRK